MTQATVGIIVFPGSNCEQDVACALEYLGTAWRYVWHTESDLSGLDSLVLPGGFAYGDYLRTGAIAAFSPIMAAVKDFAAAGRPVLGICNGFQILCESGLLPGALRRNRGLKFRCTSVDLKVSTANSPFTAGYSWGQVVRIPINHFDGNYYCSGGVLEELIAGDRIAFRYCAPDGAVDDAANPNGALDNIAGVLSASRNILGMMPHPERAVDPEVSGSDGRPIFVSMLQAARRLEETASF